MLSLTRREGETILIGDDVKVVIATVGTKKVRVWIDAPEDIRILREEVLDRNLEEAS